MDEGTFIPNQQVDHLDTPASRHKIKVKMLNPMLSLKIKVKILGIVWKSSL